MSGNFKRLLLNENLDIEVIKAIDELISDDVYAATWDAITDVAPSKNAIYDKINVMDTLIDANTTVAEVADLIATHTTVTAHHPFTDDANIYYVNTEAELIAAIADIDDNGSGNITLSGIINITNDITLTGTITLGTGSYIIEGIGDDTLIDGDGDWDVIDATAASSFIIRNIKIEIGTTTITKYAIKVASNSLVDGISINDGSANNAGIVISDSSSNVVISNSYFSGTMNYGVNCGASVSGTRIIGNHFTGGNGAGNTVAMGASDDKTIISNNWSNMNCYAHFYILSGADENIISNNYCEGGKYGVVTSAGNRNVITGNIFNNQTENHGNDRGVIFINSNNNTVSNNLIYSGTNSGAGNMYGIYQHGGTGNKYFGNVYTGNDIDDIYINTVSAEIDSRGGKDLNIYYVNTETELNTAIADIEDNTTGNITHTGRIIITDNIALTGTITLNDASANYIIEGQGHGTVIDTVTDRKAFDITSVSSCVLRNFRVDATAVSSFTEIIDISTPNVLIDNLQIQGNTNQGYGIHTSANNIIIKNCEIYNCYYTIILNIGSGFCRVVNNILHDSNTYGVWSRGTFAIINNNNIYSISSGIHVAAEQTIVYGNTVRWCKRGILSVGVVDVVIIGNTINDCDSNDGTDRGAIGILTSSSKNIVMGNTITDSNNTGAGTTYAIYIDNAACNDNLIAANIFNGNDGTIQDLGTNTIIYGDDTAYAASWNGDLGTPTKNAVYDEIIKKLTQIIEPSLGSNLDYQGIILELTVAGLTVGQCVYVNGNNTGALADADAVGTMPAAGVYVGVNKVLTHGTIRQDAWDWTAGDRLYVGTDGNLTDTAPAGAGDYIQIMGIAVNADAVMIMPSLSEVKHI